MRDAQALAVEYERAADELREICERDPDPELRKAIRETLALAATAETVDPAALEGGLRVMAAALRKLRA